MKKIYFIYFLAFLAGVMSCGNDEEVIPNIPEPEPEQEFMVTTLAGSGAPGSLDGNGSQASFYHPHGMIWSDAVDGSLLVSEFSNHLLRYVTADGEVGSVAGNTEAGWNDDDDLAEVRFNRPFGLAEFGDRVYIADWGNHVIRVWTPDGISTYVGEQGSPGYLDGGVHQTFNGPAGVAVDQEGNVYVADEGNHAIRKIDPNLEVSTLAGNGLPGDADGQGVDAQFRSPNAITLGHDGYLYVSDFANHTIRKVSPEDGTVTTVAGQKGVAGFQDGPASEAKFNLPQGLVTVLTGPNKLGLIVADRNNHRLRFIDLQSLEVVTFAGTGAPGNNDGKMDQATFNEPYSVALGPTGELFVATAHSIRLIKAE